MDALTAATEAADTTRPEDGLRAVAALRRLTDSLELAHGRTPAGRGTKGDIEREHPE